jgi:2-polyprenyl-6-methoxyphenol hydroxylase-like FAD-dependent oxidoreductase
MDKSNLSSDSGAALHLCPNASGILHRWGLKAQNFGPSLMSRYIERAQDGRTLKDVDLTESNARWPHPWQLVHRASFHQELKRVAVSGEGGGVPVILLSKHRVVDVNPQLGATLENGKLVSADVILGADGIYVRVP